MATAPSTIYRPDYESKLVAVISAPASEQIEELERISRPENFIYSEQIFDNALTRQADYTSMRRKRLLKLRNLWGVISILCVVGILVSIVTRVSYEPAAALTACSAGLLAVFSMKVADVKR